jgi:hypothetical protein
VTSVDHASDPSPVLRFQHRWFQDERWYDLLCILDDAASEIYYAQLVENEATVLVIAACAR